MLSKLSKKQTFYSNKDNLIKENYSLLSKASEIIENYNDMFSDIQKLTGDAKTLASKQNRSSVDIIKTLDNEQALSSVKPSFMQNISCFSFGKGNLDKYNTLILPLIKNLLKASKLDMSFTELIKSSCNLEDTPKLSDALMLSKQNDSHEQLLKKKLHSFLGEMMQWNASSNALSKELLFNKHFATERPAQTMELRTQDIQEWWNELKDASKKNLIKQPTVPALDFINRENGNRKLNLLCVFTNERDYEETSSDFTKMRHDEDIRIILPMTRNIVVASNVLTISDEHNQHITIFFRNPLKAKFDYKYSNLFTGKQFRFNNSMDVMGNLKERAQSSRKRRFNSLIINQVAKPWQNDKVVYESPKQINEKKIGNDSLLLLQEPILLNCKVQNKTKQVLMYKAHSASNRLENERKNSFSKTIEELLAKSIHYEGENVHLVFDPLKLASRLKKENNNLNRSNYCKCKHNFISSYIYKKLLQYRNVHMVGDTNYENKNFRSTLPKDGRAMQEKNISGMSSKQASMIFLPKTSFSDTNNMLGAIENAVQENTGNEISDESSITAHSCLDLPKNFSESAKRRNFDVEELFGANKSKIRWQVSRTALKQINTKQVVSSVFRHFFHFYSLFGGNLRSGTVITRSGSNYWLKVAGVATDPCSLRLAGNLFTTMAGKKVVLNIYDYIRFLVVFARTRRLIIQEVVKQMMGYKQLSESVSIKDKCKKCTMLKNQETGSTDLCYEENNLSVSRSLPNMLPPKINTGVRNRSCFSQEIF